MCRPATFVRLIDEILRRVDVEVAGNGMFGGALPTRLPHAKVGGRLIWKSPLTHAGGVGIHAVQRRSA